MAYQVSGEGGIEIPQAVPTGWRRSSPLMSSTTWDGANGVIQSNTGIPITVTTLTGTGSNLWSLISGTVGASRSLDCSGNWLSNRDAADARTIAYYGTGGPSSQPTDESGYGGFPTLAAGTPCTDSDHDGIPDAYEIAHGLNPNDASDAQRTQPDGYTNLEHYLNGQ
jgi:hypothetical protein